LISKPARGEALLPVLSTYHAGENAQRTILVGLIIITITDDKAPIIIIIIIHRRQEAPPQYQNPTPAQVCCLLTSFVIRSSRSRFAIPALSRPPPDFLQELGYVDLLADEFQHPRVFQHTPRSSAVGRVALETEDENFVLVCES